MIPGNCQSPGIVTQKLHNFLGRYLQILQPPGNVTRKSLRKKTFWLITNKESFPQVLWIPEKNQSSKIPLKSFRGTVA